MKTALIIALICLVVGAILVGTGWVLLQKNPTDMNTIKDVSKVYHISEAPTQINISTTESRIEIRPIEGDEWSVECKDKEKVYHTIDLTDGVLTIKQIDKRAWYDRISILNGFQNLSVIVYLPLQEYENLSIRSVSGSIKVEEGLAFSNADLQNTSGSVTCASSVAGSLAIRNTSGSITVKGSVGVDLNVKNTSGSITISGGVNGKLNVANSSGRIEIKAATPTSAIIKNTSGGIYLCDVVCKETCEISNTSGSIQLERCDAFSFDLQSASGSIRGSILSAKSFDCRSTSGSVRTPQNGNGGMFKARSTSGSIKIEIASSAK